MKKSLFLTSFLAITLTTNAWCATASPGYYFPANTSGTCSARQCDANYYCPGVSATSCTSQLGRVACSGVGGGAFTKSAAGARSEEYCFKVSSATNCSTLNSGSNVTYSNSTAYVRTHFNPDDTNYANGASMLVNGTLNNSAVTPGRCNTSGCVTNYLQRSAPGPLVSYRLQGVPFKSNPNVYYRGFNDNTSAANSGNNNNGSHTSISNGYWKVVWPDSKYVLGIATCSSTTPDNALTASPFYDSLPFPNTSGSSCWCKMNKYNIGSGEVETTGNRWVFLGLYNNNNSTPCNPYCPKLCAMAFSRDTKSVLTNSSYSNYLMRDLIMDSYDIERTCSNIVTIKWYASDGSSLLTSNTCTYHPTTTGGVTVPLSSVPTPAPGYHFSGWSVMQQAH